MSNTRKLVVKLLTRMDESGSYSNILLGESLKRRDLSPQDKKFITALFYGTVERQYTIDEIIKELSSKKNLKLSSELKNIIRIAVYQLLYMDSVPDNAAVNESVELAKQIKRPAVSGYVNALLREFIRTGKKLPVINNRSEQLAIDYSCPVWLVKKWMNEYNDRVCEEMLKASVGRAPIIVKVNTLYAPIEDTLKMLSDEGISYNKISVLPDCFEINSPISIEETNAYKNGRIHVQDISSQFCVAALDPKENDIVLDLCAAPGGKTFTIAQYMNNKGKVYAFDLHENRVKLIRQDAKRLGLTCVRSRTNDALVYRKDMPMANKVLCDVPCSGLGVIRKKPEIKYKKPEDFDKLPGIQFEILDKSAAYVKRGGILVYSTCTLSRAENDEVANIFLSQHPEFTACALGENFGNDRNKTRITFSPGNYNLDGFFIAKFKKVR